MSAALVAGLVAGYGIAIPIGAISALVISLSARAGLRVGVAAALGVATVDGLYAVIAVLGGAALAPVIAPMSTPLRWVGAVVLLALALRTAVVALRRHRSPTPDDAPVGLGTPGRAYAGLFGLTLLNPATIIYFGALVLGQQATLVGAELAVFAAAAFVASASWALLLAGGGSLVGRLITGPRGRLGTALVSSVVIAGLAVHLLLG